MAICTLCPRRCGRDRAVEAGYCGAPAGAGFLIGRAAPHFWEEPCISGTKGSGAVFFAGCTLRCGYCQNYELSRGKEGVRVDAARLVEILFELKEKGVHNINLVTADPYAAELAPLLRSVKDELRLPVVFNCSGYESEEMLALLDGLVDVYLPDWKYADPELAAALSGAADYPAVAGRALSLMFSQVGRPVFDQKGLLKKGLLVRHLLLPGHRSDSLRAIGLLRERFLPEDILFSLMSQYTPNGRSGPARRLTRFEYESVAAFVKKCGFSGYFQDFSSQNASFTPAFDGEGVTK